MRERAPQKRELGFLRTTHSRAMTTAGTVARAGTAAPVEVAPRSFALLAQHLAAAEQGHAADDAFALHGVGVEEVGYRAHAHATAPRVPPEGRQHGRREAQGMSLRVDRRTFLAGHSTSPASDSQSRSIY